MAEAQIHPPSPSRVAEARRAGLAPSPMLTGLGGALLGLALAQRSLLPQVWERLSALLSEPLLALGQGDLEQANQLALVQLSRLGLSLFWAALLVLGCAALVGVLAQGFVFSWPQRSRRRFQRAKQSYVAAVLWSIGVCGLLLGSVHQALWLEPAGFSSLLARWWVRASMLALGVALVDASFARVQFFRALWLTRREQRDELREAYGSPELRAARAEARHASRAGVAE